MLLFLLGSWLAISLVPFSGPRALCRFCMLFKAVVGHEDTIPPIQVGMGLAWPTRQWTTPNLYSFPKHEKRLNKTYPLLIWHSYGKWPIYRWFTFQKWRFSIAKCWITSRYPNKTGMSANQPANLPACRCHIAEIHQPTGAKLRNDDQNTMCLDILYWN